MPKFERSAVPDGGSQAFRRFMTAQREINEFYWIHRISNDVLMKSAAADGGLGPRELLDQLSLTSDARTKLGHTFEDLKARAKAADRWMRAATLLLATSAFERYVAEISALAVASDPLLSGSWPKVVDGLLLAKFSLNAPQRDLVPLTKGGWSQRLAAYKSAFGYVPPAFLEKEGELEKMRRARNNIAHEFGMIAPVGLSVSTASLMLLKADQDPTLRTSVSHTRLREWLGVLMEAARAIDASLMPTHIGSFELASFYLEWRRDPDGIEGQLKLQLPSYKRGNDGRFSSVVGRFWRPVGREYTLGLERFVNRL